MRDMTSQTLKPLLLHMCFCCNTSRFLDDVDDNDADADADADADMWLCAAQSDISELERTRESMARELVSVCLQNEDLTDRLNYHDSLLRKHNVSRTRHTQLISYVVSEVTYIVSGGALNSTHSLTTYLFLASLSSCFNTS